MRRYFAFSATREGAEAALPVRLPLKRTQEAVRKSLINVGGLTYPLLQRPVMWVNPSESGAGALFTFDRQRPYGDVRFDEDLSFVAMREPTEDEADPPMIYLEALTWEFVFTLHFFEKLVAEFDRRGTFRIGLGLAGFQGAHVDWAGFEEEAETERRYGLLTNWRFMPSSDVSSFEVPGVYLPTTSSDLREAIANVIAETAFAVKGRRRTALGDNSESRLNLSLPSIRRVVENAWERIPRSDSGPR